MAGILGLGDNVCDLYLHTHTMYAGGQALNVSVYAAQLGTESAYLGVLGTDALAEHVLAALERYGVGHARCRRTEGENGFACVALDDGDRVFLGSNRGGVLQKTPIVLDADDLAYAAAFDAVHTTNNSFTDGELPRLAALPGLLSYDFSGRWNEPGKAEQVCPFADLAFLSCGGLSDAEALSVCRNLHENGCGAVVATLGGRGALAWDGMRAFFQSSRPVRAVDTMGAGDSFAACLLVKIVQALESGGKSRWRQSGFRAEVLPAAMADAAEFAAHTCLVGGAFGFAAPIPEGMDPRIEEVAGRR